MIVPAIYLNLCTSSCQAIEQRVLLSWSKSHKPIVVYSFHLFVFCLISLDFFLFCSYQALEITLCIAIEKNKTFLVLSLSRTTTLNLYLHTYDYIEVNLNCVISLSEKNQMKKKSLLKSISSSQFISIKIEREREKNNKENSEETLKKSFVRIKSQLVDSTIEI